MGSPIFRFFLSIYVFLYRLTAGSFGGKVQGLSVLLLTTSGRKTGKLRTTPLGYFEQDGGYVIIGHPQAKIQIKEKQFEVNARIVGSEKRSQLWERLVEISPAYGNYAKKTNREIPLVFLRSAKS
jgi:deazaflavin-dependent oxidoreductase (nitroreductase family)